MTAPRKDDCEEVVTLARAVGLAGFTAAGTDDDKKQVEAVSRQIAGPAYSSASEVVALARAVGLAGFRSAETDEEMGRVEALRPQRSDSVAPGADVVALARAVGLSGYAPARTHAEKKLVASVSERLAADHSGRRIAAVSDTNSAPRLALAKFPAASPAPLKLTIPVQRQTLSLPSTDAASQLGVNAARPLHVVFEINSASGERAAAEWQRKNGSIAVHGNKGDYWVQGHIGGRTIIVFRAPTDVASQEILRRVTTPGRLDSDGHFTVSQSRGPLPKSARYRGPGAKAFASVEPNAAPPLPQHLLKALARSVSQ